MAMLRRFAVTIAGAVLLLLGAVMVVLPGPGILFVVAGLAVLATEFVWARSLLAHARRHAQRVQEAAVASPLRTAGSVVFAIGMVVLGAAMLARPDITWPVLTALLDAVWSPVTGAVMVITGLVLGTSTVLTFRTARGDETTYTPDPEAYPGPAPAGASPLPESRGQAPV